MSTLIVKTVRHPSDVENISEYYNTEFLKHPRADIYGFLNPTDELAPSAIKEVSDVFALDMEFIGVVYFDKYLIKRINNLHGKVDNYITQLYPPFENNSKNIFNPTIFVNGHINVPIFDTKLNNLKTYDVIQKLSKISKIIHIPKILITSEYTHTNIKEELDLYVRQSGS